MLNGVATALTGTASSAGVVEVDLVNEVTVSQEDYICMRMAQTAAGGAVLASWSAEWAEAA